MNNKSFTLIELLVVIAIIGVLAAIVITSMSGAITRSKIARLQIFSDSIRAQLSDSLVSWWSFNEGTGTDAKDMWEGNHGELKNFDFDEDSGWRSGGDCVSGSCLEFDGINDYVDCGSDIELSFPPYTVELFFQPSELGRTHSLVQLFSGSGWSDPNFKLASSDKLLIGLNKYRYSDKILTNQDIGKWQHLVFVVGSSDANDFHIYVDAQNEDGYVYNTGIIPEVTGCKIGKMGSDSNSLAHGLIDEVRIYNSAATITQIQSQYLAGLDKLLSNRAISKSEYNQRIKKLSKEIVIE